METGGKKVIVPLVMKIAQHPKAKLFYLILLGTRSNTTLRDLPHRQLIFLAKYQSSFGREPSNSFV